MDDRNTSTPAVGCAQGAVVPDGLENRSYPTLCCPSRTAPVREESARTDRSLEKVRTRQFGLKRKFPIFDTGYLCPFNLR